MSNLNTIDLRPYVKNRGRRKYSGASEKISLFAYYKIPAELSCLRNKEYQINKELSLVNNREELLETINLYDNPENMFEIQNKNSKIKLMDNFINKDTELVSKIFNYNNMSIPNSILGSINSLNNFILYLRYDTKTPCFTYRSKFNLRGLPKRKDKGQKVNIKSIMLKVLLDDILKNAHKRKLLIESGTKPFSYLSLIIKQDTTDNDNMSYSVHYNNILSSSKLYINALRIVRALLLNFEDVNKAFEEGMKIVEFNMENKNSLLADLVETYTIVEEPKAEATDESCDTQSPAQETK